MVAWSAVDNSGTVKTWNRQGLGAGEIALSHWDPGVDVDLTQLLTAAHDSGLTPAYLARRLVTPPRRCGPAPGAAGLSRRRGRPMEKASAIALS